MKARFLWAVLVGWGLLAQVCAAQAGPAAFPLAGDWEGSYVVDGKVGHLMLHMSTTPEGKMTALMDYLDEGVSGDPAIGGSFDGSHLVLRFFYWKPNANGDFEYKVSIYEATVNEAGSAMEGVWTQDGTRAVNFKRLTWVVRVPKPAAPTIFDGDWAGIEYETENIELHFTLHLHNTEDGLRATMDCKEERFKGALASKVVYDQQRREIAITIGSSLFRGKMSADGKALDTDMTEPGFHFVIHFDRVDSGQKQVPQGSVGAGGH